MEDKELSGEILSRLDALAETLGTTAEYLWATLIDGVVARGWVLFGVGAFFFAVGLSAVIWGLWSRLREKCRHSDAPDGSIFLGMIFGVLSLIIVAVSIVDIVAPQLEAMKILRGGK